MRNNWNLFIVCFLCVLCFQPYQVNAQTQSQKKITIEISNERLPSVLKRLEKLSGYKILFTYDDVKKFTVSGSVKDKSIEQTLDIILANKPLEYHIEDQFITITSKGPSKQAKVFNVKGVVISGDDGQPLIGATVVIKGSKSGVLTDIDGKFSIENVSNKSLLQFSYIGMKPQDLTPAPNMNVTLMPDVQTLSEVVVTGMQKMDKRLFTGATKQLSADEVKLDGLPDISRGLEGRAAGVSVQNVSGTFGTAPKIRVRGATSIFGSSKPLWVVDGVIMEDAIDVGPDDLSSGDAETLISSAIAGLNSDDIESFQILKDGSATSIYGARAMAGVIVVTTKKGKAGVSKISYTGEFTTRMIPSYKEFNIMNSQEQMGIYKEMEQKYNEIISPVVEQESKEEKAEVVQEETKLPEALQEEKVNAESLENETIIPIVFDNSDKDNENEQVLNEDEVLYGANTNVVENNEKTNNDETNEMQNQETPQNAEINAKQQPSEKTTPQDSKEKILSFEEMYKELFGKEPYGGRKQPESEKKEEEEAGFYALDDNMEDKNVSIFESNADAQKIQYKFISYSPD